MLRALAASLRNPGRLRLDRIGPPSKPSLSSYRNSSTSLAPNSQLPTTSSENVLPLQSVSSDTPAADSKHVEWKAYLTLLGHDLPQQYAQLVHQGYDANWESFLRNHDSDGTRPSREFRLALRMLGHIPSYDVLNRSQTREYERGYLRDFRAGPRMPYEEWSKLRLIKRGEKIRAARANNRRIPRPGDPPQGAPRIRHTTTKFGVWTLLPSSSDDDRRQWTWYTVTRRAESRSIAWSVTVYNDRERLGVARMYLDCSSWPDGSAKVIRPIFDEEIKAIRILTVDGEMLPNLYYLETMVNTKGMHPLLRLCVLNGHISPDKIPAKMFIPSLDLQTNLDNQFYSEFFIHPQKIVYSPKADAVMGRKVWAVCNLGEHLQQTFCLLNFHMDPTDPTLERTPDGQIRVVVVPYIHPDDETLRFYDVNAKKDFPVSRRNKNAPPGFYGAEVAQKWPKAFEWARSLGHWKDVPLNPQTTTDPVDS